MNQILNIEGTIKKLREPSNWLMQPRGKHWKDVSNVYDRTPFEAADLLETLHHQLQKAREEERKQTLREIDIGDNDYITARRAVAELSGIPMMAITFDEHIKVIKEKLNHSELNQDV